MIDLSVAGYLKTFNVVDSRFIQELKAGFAHASSKEKKPDAIEETKEEKPAEDDKKAKGKAKKAKASSGLQLGKGTR